MQVKNMRWMILAILMAVIFASGVFLGTYRSETPAMATGAQQKRPSAQPAPAPADDGFGTPGTIGADADANGAGRDSYRVGPGQDKRDRFAELKKREPGTETDWENAYEAQNTLDSALAGDEDDAIAVSDLVTQCYQDHPNERSVENSLSRITQNVEAGNPLPVTLLPATGEMLSFTNLADYEAFVWMRFTECQSTRELFGEALRNRLVEMALNGNVTARYLYAMWLPARSGNGADELVDWITYQSQAWDFTWANIREGEPLGLLAYGRSLEQVGQVYFTPRNVSFGPAFIIAAQSCGLNNRSVNQKVDYMTGVWRQHNQVQRIKLAENLSDEIVRMFCR